MATYTPLSPAAMATIPAMPVPGGGQPNFVDPFDKGPYEVGGSYFLLALAVCFFINRIYVKFFTTKKPWWDDLTCTLGLVFAIIKTGGYVYMTTVGPVGIHQWNVSVAQLSNHKNLVVRVFSASKIWQHTNMCARLPG